MIGIIDIGIGNVGSVYKILDKLSVEYAVIDGPNDLDDVSKLIFPGVGSYSRAMQKLNEKNLTQALIDYLRENRPFLGICLGMQLLAKSGYEDKITRGLGIIDGLICKLHPSQGFSLPHVGWNSINHDRRGLFNGIHPETDFYFVHNYYMKINSPCKSFHFDYGGKFTAYVNLGNIHGVQFHPEKSQRSGIKLIENFLC